MRTALVLGGASCLWDDVQGYVGPVDGVVACNDAGYAWPGALDAWVSLHGDHLRDRWVPERRRRGFPPARRTICQNQSAPNNARGLEQTAHEFFPHQGGGSSGLFAAKVALIDLGFDRVVLCGVPLTRTPHFHNATPWPAVEGFKPAWLNLPEATRSRMRSMSGWTRHLLGAPDELRAFEVRDAG